MICGYLSVIEASFLSSRCMLLGHNTFLLLQFMLHMMFHILPLAVLKEEHSCIYPSKHKLHLMSLQRCKYSREDNRSGIDFGITKFSFC